MKWVNPQAAGAQGNEKPREKISTITGRELKLCEE